jgi:4-hydroxybenzoate polyprenyltransferase
MNHLTIDSARYYGMLAFLLAWFIAKGTFKNVPDFHGDLAAGLRTSATVLGTWRKAAIVTMTVTLTAYLSLALLVYFGLESPQLLFALLWLIPVTWNCLRLIRAEDGAIGNDCLKVDMLISSGFMASVLLLLSWRWENILVILCSGLILVGSDWLNLDSRRRKDVTPS